MNTKAFRQVIKQALNASGATHLHSYTDKIQGGGYSPVAQRRVCFYGVHVSNDYFYGLVTEVEALGGHITGLYQRGAGVVNLNIRGTCEL